MIYKPHEHICLPSRTLAIVFGSVLHDLSRREVGICLCLARKGPQKAATALQSLHQSNGVSANWQATLGCYYPSPDYYGITQEEDTPRWGEGGRELPNEFWHYRPQQRNL